MADGDTDKAAPASGPSKAAPASGPSDRWPWNAFVVVVGVGALLILANMALTKLVTTGPAPAGGKVGAADAISLITASGAILTGIIGAYFGVNIASKASNTTQATQLQANEALKTAVAAAATADPNSELARQLVRNLVPQSADR